MEKTMAQNKTAQIEKKYFLGMAFPKYNHPAKLYDETNINEINNIKSSSGGTSYYIGYFQNNRLIRFEKYLHNEKIMEFNYFYDEKDNMIKYIKNIPKK
ncbi:MAG: hypothetical protein Q4E77_08460 [Conchiformibius sp.]|nr:hypothetical protein [Conchiformibius sp.]